jgi:basic membrane protein A
MTKSNTIAFIGGMELDTTLGKYKGYTEAAQFVNKDVKVLDPVYAGSFSATDKGIEFAKAMIDQGADVFFGDASAVDSGARQAIDEANKASGSVKVFDIGQPADLLGQNECVICSQVTDNSSCSPSRCRLSRTASSAARPSTARCRTAFCPPAR